MARRRTLLGLLAGVLALLLGLAWWSQRGPRTTGDDIAIFQSPSAGATSSAAPKSAATQSGSTNSGTPEPSSTKSSTTRPSGTPSSALPKGCAASHSPMVPTRIELRSMGVTSPVLSLGLADDGTPATPPFNEPYTVGWYNLGPKPGASKGKAVLTAHTFSEGRALGNDMAEPDTGLRAGAVVALSDARGRTQCWRVTGATKVWVADYDPNSTVLYDDGGAPQLAIVICWDHVKSSKSWASRIIYHAEPLA